MGEVWKASHKLLARAAAVKIIRPDVVDQENRAADTAAARFKREANVIAKLQSPHTVYLYDFGVANDGRFYYVMELLDGISLQALVGDSGPLAPGRAVHVLSQMCESLHEAHERGLVHRDLKPSNVMVCRVALTFDFVKVLDFGLAKTIGDAGLTQLTMAGTTTGTPGYMAPEIALVRGLDRSARRHLRARLRGLLPADGNHGLRRGKPHPDGAAARAAGARPALHAYQHRDSTGARAAGHAVPGEAAGGPAADHGRRRRAAGELRGGAVDERRRPAVVERAPARIRSRSNARSQSECRAGQPASSL